MDDIYLGFARRLRDRRRELLLTQKELAAQLSYSEKAVSKWERGGALPPSCILPELARILKTSIDSLMLCEGEIKYFLGIDGGGTKTEFLLVGDDGVTLAREVLGASNPNDVGFDASEQILARGINAVCDGYDTRLISTFLGLAGAKSADNMQRLSLFMSKFNFGRFAIDSDMETAAAAGLKSEDGVAVICGTGSVAYVKRGQERIRIGGYGYLFGDPASGYNFGRDAIFAALKDEDGSGEKTVITSIIRATLGKETILPSLSLFYKGGKKEIAKYAFAVFEAVHMGDSVAMKILDDNLSGLASMIRSAAERLDTGRVKVVLNGGVAEKNPEILTMLTEKLSGERVAYEVSVCENKPIVGALYLAGLHI